MAEFDGQVAPVTGGGSGIGRAAGGLLADRGASVTLCGLDPGDIQRAAAATGAHGLAADVTDEESVARVVAETVRRFGRLDIVVAVAGIQR